MAKTTKPVVKKKTRPAKTPAKATVKAPAKAEKKAAAVPAVAASDTVDLVQTDFEVHHDHWDKLEAEPAPQEEKELLFTDIEAAPEFAEEEWMEKPEAEEEKPLAGA